MNATYTYDSKKVTIKNGIVTYSDFEHCVVGQKPNVKALRACGWKKQTAPAVYFAHGTTSANRFSR